MRTIGNILWFICGGFVNGLLWWLVGLLWCITIVGIPIGTQCFKLSRVSFFPFGKQINYGTGAGSLLLNVLWIIFGGIPLAAESFAAGLVCCLTIIGIPFGLQYFKIAMLSLVPFGATIID